MARAGGFADPAEPLDAAGLRAARAFRVPGSAPFHVLSSPATAARETAAALGMIAEVAAPLADIGYGRWTGRTLAEVRAGHLAAWIANPSAGTPGGETVAAVCARVSPWLAEQAGRNAPVLAITHPMIVRVILTIALGLPLESALRIDIAPLSTTTLSWNRVWRLQALEPANA